MNDAEAIRAFWYAEGRDTYRPIWFQKNDAFDGEIRDRFGALIRPAREGTFDNWAETPEGTLALLILLLKQNPKPPPQQKRSRSRYLWSSHGFCPHLTAARRQLGRRCPVQRCARALAHRPTA
mgnify:CR=1 FL=1